MTALGCAIWASGFVTAGLLLGTSWQHSGNALRIPLVLLGAATVLGLLVKARFRKS